MLLSGRGTEPGSRSAGCGVRAGTGEQRPRAARGAGSGTRSGGGSATRGEARAADPGAGHRRGSTGSGLPTGAFAPSVGTAGLACMPCVPGAPSGARWGAVWAGAGALLEEHPAAAVGGVLRQV